MTKSWTKASLEIGTGAHVQAGVQEAVIGFRVGTTVGFGVRQQSVAKLDTVRNRRSSLVSDWL